MSGWMPGSARSRFTVHRRVWLLALVVVLLCASASLAVVGFTYYRDADNDGYGDPNDSVVDVSPPAGYVDIAGDLNDSDDTVYPGAPELCDGLDNDQDGNLAAFESDADGDKWVSGSWDSGGWDGDPSILGGGDLNDSDNTVYPGALERVDGQDNDCDGQLGANESDADGDGYVSGWEDVGGWDVPPTPGFGDADDSDDTVYPGAPELCDGLDNDQDGNLAAFESDADGDKWVSGSWDSGGWDGDPTILGGGDLNDSDNTVYPGALERIDGQDNDCDGQLHPSEVDSDGDGFVHGAEDVGGWDVPPRPGFDDADDSDATVYPGAPELCDGLDNDQDGNLAAFESDADGDKWVPGSWDSGGWDGDPTILGGGDADDSDPTVNPGASELIDGLDNDQDGNLHPAEVDNDGDGFVEGTEDAGGWDAPPAPGFGDMDDTDATVYPGARVEVAGSNRYATAVEASERAYPGGASTVVIAVGTNWPDALGGAALAGMVDGPLLLTGPDSIPQEVVDEVGRLGATGAYILGGTGAVSETVEDALEALLSTEATRLAGSNRYETAELVAAEVIRLAGAGFCGRSFVATGENFPDALGASPLASSLGAPIYLAPRDGGVRMSAEITSTAILGGIGAVSGATEAALDGLLGADNVDRVGGSDRYETAVLIAEHGVAHGLSWQRVGISTGMAFPDALSGGAMLGTTDSLLLLTAPDELSAVTSSCLATNKADIDVAYYLGGTGAVSAQVRASVVAALQ